ncbi:MAG TPA: hypothetical protein PLD05_14475, partial [Thermogutta sp.]|nr:hypothetical protein [Thermogutta sp.]
RHGGLPLRFDWVGATPRGCAVLGAVRSLRVRHGARGSSGTGPTGVPALICNAVRRLFRYGRPVRLLPAPAWMRNESSRRCQKRIWARIFTSAGGMCRGLSRAVNHLRNAARQAIVAN